MTTDLTTKAVPFLDTHLVLPLLDFLNENKVYPSDELMKSKLAVLNGTDLLDLSKTVSGELKEDFDYDSKKKECEKNLEEVRSNCEGLLKWIEEHGSDIESLKKENKYNSTHLQKELKVDVDAKNLQAYAKRQYESGLYKEAAKTLDHCIYLCAEEEAPKHLPSVWGKLSTSILLKNWEQAAETVTELKDLIDSGKIGTSLDQLQQRAFLLHWSLFVFSQLENGSNKLVELYLQVDYVNALQTTCPHLLRYLVFAMVMGDRKNSNITGEVLRIVQQEESNYSDAFTVFTKSILFDFDFDGYQEKLNSCVEVLSKDYFLQSSEEEFKKNAKLFVLETYCHIYTSIDLGSLVSSFGFSNNEEAESWVNNLVTLSKLTAKVVDGKVVVENKTPSVYEQVTEKTEKLSVQSSNLINNLSQEA